MSESNAKNWPALLSRWAARLTGIAIGGLFLLFFIGEGNVSQLMQVSRVEWALIACIPILFIIGVIVAWKREIIGGVVILISVIAFNTIDMAAARTFTGNIEFAFVTIPGILFLLAAFLDRKGHQGSGRLHAMPQ